MTRGKLVGLQKYSTDVFTRSFIKINRVHLMFTNVYAVAVDLQYAVKKYWQGEMSSLPY